MSESVLVLVLRVLLRGECVVEVAEEEAADPAVHAVQATVEGREAQRRGFTSTKSTRSPPPTNELPAPSATTDDLPVRIAGILRILHIIRILLL